MEGWVKIYRSILDWEWFGDSKMVHLFVYLLAKANFEDRQWQGIIVKRGQIAISIAEISKVSHLSAQSIRSCIKRLKSTNEITTQSTSKFTIITITNYDDYQGVENGSNKPANKPSNKRVTNEQQTSNKQHKNIRSKEDKNKREKENIPPIVPLKEKETETALTAFEEFWNAYHRITSLNKTDREAASKYWHRLSQVEQRRARDNIQPYYNSLNEVKWCKKARTYLSDKNFNDEFTLQTNKLGIAL